MAVEIRLVQRFPKVTGRWHDNPHTLITELAESGAGDETIMEIAGHVSRSMLRHYLHRLRPHIRYIPSSDILGELRKGQSFS